MTPQEQNSKEIKAKFEEMESDELVRLRIIPDVCASIDDLLGDMFNPEICPDIDPKTLASEREDYIAKINNDGVWGIVGEYWDGEEWVNVDSCWGFVGDEWEGSGYDIDIMDSVIKKLESLKHCPTCNRPMKTN